MRTSQGHRSARRQAVVIVFFLIGLLPAISARTAEPAARPVDQQHAALARLRLPSSRGGRQPLITGSAHVRVFCFLGTECPLAKLYGPRLDQLAQQFAAAGVSFIGINSNPQDSLEDVVSYAREHGIGFPILKDTDQTVAVALAATRTPEVVVLDGQGTVRYRGRIDDQYAPGIARPAATTRPLADALVAVTSGQPVLVPVTEPAGCLIQLLDRTAEQPPATSLTFAREISRILQRHCVDCHRAGEIGPFVLDDYDEVIGWGDMLLEVIDQQRMPPWHADPHYGEFANARQMPATERAQLREWVAAGMPFGDEADLPPPTVRISGWDLPREPDRVFPMAKTPFEVPAEGVIEYQYFVVDPGFTEDVWVSGVAVEPGNRSVVHHAIVFLRPPDGGDQNGFGLLGGYVPGQRTPPLPTGYAQRVAAGSRLVFQMHYTPTGKPEEDCTQVGILLADPDEVTHEVFTIGGVEQEFEIPPGAADYQVEGRLRRVPSEGQLLAVAPHMHLRGRSFRLQADRGKQTDTLVAVPQYDFNWQHNYSFAEPIDLAAIDQLRFVMTYDNSRNNPFNPDPAEHVTWGDQTWEEMAVVFATVARPRQRGKQQLQGTAAEQRLAAEPAVDQRAEAFAVRYLKQLDRDRDGAVSRDEAPQAVRMFAFRRLDLDGDGVISRDELMQKARERFSRADSAKEPRP